MVRIRAFSAFDNKSVDTQLLEHVRINDGLVGGTYDGLTLRFYGDFNFPGVPEDNNWRGSIRSVSAFEEGGDLAWNVRGLNLSPLRIDGSTPFGEVTRSVMSRSDDVVGSSRGDAIRGYDGADKIRGRAGADRIEGDNGADVLKGERGDDAVKGGAGSDVIVGGRGNDRLIGGKGRDEFRFNVGSDEDRIVDFEVGRDKLKFANGADSFSDLDLTQRGDNLLIGYGRRGDEIVLKNVDRSEFDAGDVLF
ncbi:MAG: hypothetical protein AAF192_19305 [Pseudomonadota bacterium]